MSKARELFEEAAKANLRKFDEEAQSEGRRVSHKIMTACNGEQAAFVVYGCVTVLFTIVTRQIAKREKVGPQAAVELLRNLADNIEMLLKTIR